MQGAGPSGPGRVGNRVVMTLLGLGLVLVALGFSDPVYAQNRTPAEATQHALDELSNCRAQQRPECSTETPTPVQTRMPAATGTPVIVTPTPTAEPATVVPSATPESAIWCWQRDPQVGDPNNDWIVFDNQ